MTSIWTRMLIGMRSLAGKKEVILNLSNPYIFPMLLKMIMVFLRALTKPYG